jgi:hypothetical protein
LERKRYSIRGDGCLAWLAPQPVLIDAMSALLKDARHWHLRAEEARYLAEQLTDLVAKSNFLKTADDYDRLAVRAALRMEDQKESSAE